MDICKGCWFHDVLKVFSINQYFKWEGSIHQWHKWWAQVGQKSQTYTSKCINFSQVTRSENAGVVCSMCMKNWPAAVKEIRSNFRGYQQRKKPKHKPTCFIYWFLANWTPFSTEIAKFAIVTISKGLCLHVNTHTCFLASGEQVIWHFYFCHSKYFRKCGYLFLETISQSSLPNPGIKD